MILATHLRLLFSLPLVVLCQTPPSPSASSPLPHSLPPPPNDTNVFITNFTFTDHSRVDPFAPCCHQPRRLVLTLFQPTNCTTTKQKPYMPPATAALYDTMFSSLGIPNGTFEAFRLEMCPSPPKNTDFPVVLFSTGLGGSRLTYSVLCQWVASIGFNVVSIDHTYDAPIVEFPDGSFILAANITLPDDLPKLLAARVADVQSVLKLLSNSTAAKEKGIPLFNTKHVGMFGHSLGGATAAESMLVEPTLVGGLNMDGSVHGHAVNHTQNDPFVIFAAEHHNQSNDESWTEFWQALKGTKLQLQVNETAHGSFADYLVLANSIGINASSVPAVKDIIGSINGVRMMSILRSYVGGFFQETLDSKNVRLLQGPSPLFPEVSFANMSLSSKSN